MSDTIKNVAKKLIIPSLISLVLTVSIGTIHWYFYMEPRIKEAEIKVN